MQNITINSTHTTFYKRVLATLFGSASPSGAYMLYPERAREKILRSRVVVAIIFFAAVIGYELLKKMIRHLFGASKTSQRSDQQLVEMQAQLQKQLDITTLQKQLLEKQTNITVLQAQLLEKQGIIGTSEVQLASNQAEIANLNLKLETKEQEQDKLQIKIEQQNRMLTFLNGLTDHMIITWPESEPKPLAAPPFLAIDKQEQAPLGTQAFLTPPRPPTKPMISSASRSQPQPMVFSGPFTPLWRIVPPSSFPSILSTINTDQSAYFELQKNGLMNMKFMPSQKFFEAFMSDNTSSNSTPAQTETVAASSNNLSKRFLNDNG